MGVFSTKISKGGSSHQGKKRLNYYLSRIGVSVLFSGAAVGVSHVVQATRAGADFSFALLPVILICLILKYPAFMFGPLYTSATGESVVRAYRQVGKWTIPLVGLSFICVMATVVAAVSLLSSGILMAIIGTSLNATLTAIILAMIATCLSLFFPFKKFHQSMKVVFVLLVLMSVFSLFLALPSVQLKTFSFSLELMSLTKEQIFFIAALIGWMPAGLDLPMMHSQWIIARKASAPNSDDNAIEDFNFGYLSTTVLAILFLTIGAVFFFGTDTSLPTSAGGFSKSLLGTYSAALGSGGELIIGVTLFLAIFSSLITVVDGFPRVLSEVISVGVSKTHKEEDRDSTKYRSLCAWMQLSGAAIIIFYFKGSLTVLVDFATAISFLLGPIFAFLNHKIVQLKSFTDHRTIHSALHLWSVMGLFFFSVFALYYLYLKI